MKLKEYLSLMSGSDTLIELEGIHIAAYSDPELPDADLREIREEYLTHRRRIIAEGND